MRNQANLWAGPVLAVTMQVQAIKDRWAACMQVVHKVKHQVSDQLAPNADGVPEQVL